MSSGVVIALLGAESTGKTTLSQQLAHALHNATGLRCTVVDEYLRTWCEQQQRTPRGDEQTAIAQVQHDRIAQAAATHAVVIADTTALMTAVYSRFVWVDSSLDTWAAELHARTVNVTLLMALDLPWVADGLQRDGPHVREPVDALVRELLAAGNVAWSRIGGLGAERLEQALNAVTPCLSASEKSSGLFTRLAQRNAAMPAWQTACELCDDPQCEHRLLRAAAPPST